MRKITRVLLLLGILVISAMLYFEIGERRSWPTSNNSELKRGIETFGYLFMAFISALYFLFRKKISN